MLLSAKVNYQITENLSETAVKMNNCENEQLWHLKRLKYSISADLIFPKTNILVVYIIKTTHFKFVNKAVTNSVSIRALLRDEESSF